MHTYDKFGKLKVLAIAGSLLFSLTTLAPAESEAVRAIYVSAANVPTNIAGIRTYAEPPKGFNPVTATDVELATYGFPPRPDKQADPDRYKSWEQVVALAKIRWNGELKPVPGTEHVTIPAMSSPLPEAVHPETGPQSQSNVNAAGVILTNKLTKWNDKTSFYVASSVMSVSRAQLPFDFTTCTYDYKEFSFAGIDSSSILDGTTYTLTPGLQGGVYGDVPCGGGTAGTPFYFAEFGWGYPLSRGFAINAGDVFWAYVEAYGGSSDASVYLEDLTTNMYATYSVPTPGIIGHNAGWLVFRPCCTAASNPFPLANTAEVFFDEASALNGNNIVFFPGSQASSTLILTMMGDGSDGEIEEVNQGIGGDEGKFALSFDTLGCAYYGGCTP